MDPAATSSMHDPGLAYVQKEAIKKRLALILKAAEPEGVCNYADLCYALVKSEGWDEARKLPADL